MHLDVTDLRAFYYRTRLGRAAQAAIRGRLVESWGDTKGLTVAGYGFAAPLLRPFLGASRRTIALMPAPQGVMAWPAGERNVSVLTEETRWPLETGHVDRLVLMHGLETSENAHGVLDEAERVLGPGGRMAIVVPNRGGMWARRDKTPFGYGRPYSLGQLEAQLRRHGLEPGAHMAALFQPPSHRRFWLRVGPLMERVGRRLSNRWAGGVLIVEARKQVPARPRPGLTERVRAPIEEAFGLGEPAPHPARRLAASRKPAAGKCGASAGGIAEAP